MDNSSPLIPAQEVTLLDLLDRILDKGVVVQGDLVLSVADVDLIYLGLRVMLASVDKASEMKAEALKRQHFWQVLPNDLAGAADL